MYALVDPKDRWETLIDARADVPAVEVLFPALPSAKAVRKAREAALAVYIAAGRGPDDVRAAADEGDDAARDLLYAAGEALSRELVRWSILDWRGIGDAAGVPGRPQHDLVTVDPETGERRIEPRTISAFLGERELVAAADVRFVIPWSKREAEKNGFAASPNGTSAKATAASDTAGTPATPPSAGDAPDAPIAVSTTLKNRRRKTSGA